LNIVIIIAVALVRPYAT